MFSEISSVISDFSPISLEEMDGVRLMNRVDTKYVTTEASVLEFLSLASADFRVVEIGRRRIMPYSTCYYDTPDREMFREHVRGRAARQKIRVRRYENTGAEFLEIKRKNNRGRTDKRRVPVPAGPSVFSVRSSGISSGSGSGSDRCADFPADLSLFSDFIRLKSDYSAGDLLPQIRTAFRRITLVSLAMTERLTIDTSLEFENLTTGRTFSMDGLAVIELKRDGSLHSPTAAMLHALHIHPSGFSKYCMGMALTDPALKQNTLKPRILMVHRLLSRCGTL